MHEKQFLKNFLNIYSQKKKIWKYLHVTQISLVICMILYQISQIFLYHWKFKKILIDSHVKFSVRN